VQSTRYLRRALDRHRFRKRVGIEYTIHHIVTYRVRKKRRCTIKRIGANLLLLLLLAFVGPTVVAGPEWHQAEVCPPVEAGTYCMAAEGVWDVALLDDGWRQLALTSDESVNIIDPFLGETISLLALEPAGHRFTGIPSFSPDGLLIACAMSDETVRAWDTATGQEILAVPVGSRYCTAAFSSDGTRIAAQGVSGQIAVWDLGTGDPLYVLSGLVPYDQWRVLGFDASDAYLYALGLVEQGGAYITAAWSTAGKSLVAAFIGTGYLMESGSVVSVAPLSSEYTQVSLWDSLGGNLQKILYAPGQVLAFAGRDTSTGSIPAFALADGTVSVWSLDQAREVYRLDGVGTVATTDEAEDFVILSVSISPDGSMLTTGSTISGTARNFVHIWNVLGVLL